MTWLLEYNDEWKKTNISQREYREIIQYLHQITIPEYNYKFELVENDYLELESEEVLDICFPDKTLNIKNGGQESIEQLQKLVQDATMSNDELFCKLLTINESVQGYKASKLFKRHNRTSCTCPFQAQYKLISSINEAVTTMATVN